jgi:hypothetical protein
VFVDVAFAYTNTFDANLGYSDQLQSFFFHALAMGVDPHTVTLQTFTRDEQGRGLNQSGKLQ